MSAFGSWYWHALVTASYVGSRFRKLPRRYPRICNICGYEGSFGPAGKGTRNNAKCPRCKSAERYRLFKLWLDRQPQAFQGKDVLHFAPEKSITALVRPLARSYRTADITPGRADRVLNIEAIELPDASVDAVICFHVLEHVDDAKALSEMFRILRPGGTAAIMVPIVEGWARSYENPAIITPDQRTLHFGQFDHVRYYGADLRARIRAAGFELEEFTAEEPDVFRHGLIRGEKVFVAAKSAG
ncbi:MAG: methyltransferase domain-containing protein [Alphaproteobacteria bacterium]|nr:methyltransferase domain-containing protein [Alphaproteobacteria bacterium]MBU6471970.1 methyltransferase domain-containing protein [Alphaproteobacteria bacterium]MDE2013092.1 methyltransferase domain-containing protein [Alphaproteobacteria bacterium]MDE2074387.1 methyltransferase domain-containing protein [Alphaproteobacteria bacterium]MDE2351311.1 methyltransferase domain-containing protein [Alphaproteobacteria bacterium]